MQSSHAQLRRDVVIPFKFLASVAVTTGSLLSINQQNAIADSEQQQKKPKKVKVLETPDIGIKYIEVKKGSGSYPNPGDFVVINYTGFLSDGTVFDSTETKGRKPLAFKVGKKQQIEGIESVLYYMQPGGEVTCTIPPQYAFGKDGICVKGECLVPPNETVKYVIKLKQVGAGFN